MPKIVGFLLVLAVYIQLIYTLRDVFFEFSKHGSSCMEFYAAVATGYVATGLVVFIFLMLWICK